ncbi:fumarate hydratase C-terminal domain-containing protein [bacterium]|nr:fumarate hydratase C-terminal domain-containing protein [bacterium]
MIRLNVPITDEEIMNLKVGDIVGLNGVILTARDRAHKYFIETFIDNEEIPASEAQLHQTLCEILRGGVIYHCGPIVKKFGDRFQFVASGPTTSIREEPYQDRIIEYFGLKAVIGKGGMGVRTLAACQKHRAVYLHAVGGAASIIAQSVKEVEDVYKLEFGVPEAMWKIRVENFPVTVTIDAHGNSLHQKIQEESRRVFETYL